MSIAKGLVRFAGGAADSNSAAQVLFGDFQPGNGTRYRLMFVRALSDDACEAVGNMGHPAVLTDLSTMRAMEVVDGEVPHWRWVAEKLDLNEVDARATLAGLVAMLERAAS